MKRRIVTILLSAVAVVLSAVAQSDRADYRVGKSMELLINVFKEANLYYVDSVDSDKMLKDAAKGMLEKLDPYTEYIPSSEMDDFETLTTGKYAGVGALIRQRGPWVEVIEPYKNTPSDRVGLKAGDRIVSIDGKSLKGATSELVSSMLRGDAGTSFRLVISPITDTTTTKELIIKREQIFQPSVPYYGFIGSEGVGYIRLDSFTEDCYSEILSAIKEMSREREMKGLVIDLRQNGGGIVGEAVKIASLFLPKGTKIVSLKGKIKEMDTDYVTKSAPVEPHLPLAILMSSISASASEILAGSLQDLDRAVIVGQRSYGKGLVQNTRPLGYDSYLKITTAKYYTPSGRCIQALDYTNRKEDGSVGHIPDSLIVEYNTAAGRKVYNGGGVQPDVPLEGEYYGKFTAILTAYGFIDDFANIFVTQNKPVAIDSFTVDDRTYEQFVDFMKDKTIQYESATAKKLKELRLLAEREKYADRLKEEFASIEQKIAEDKMSEMRAFEKEIREVLAGEIIKRWYYADGYIKYGIKADGEVIKAAEILENHDEYHRILTEQNTKKN